MRRRFVIDESTFVLAGKREDEHGREDLSARRLLGAIAGNCHIVVINGEVVQKYFHQCRQIPRHEIDWLLRQIFSAEPEKIHQQEDPPPLEEETEFHTRDVPFVRLAVAAQAILVTTDNQLISDLSQASVTNKYELVTVRPEHALSYAGPREE